LSFQACTKYITPKANPNATNIVPTNIAIEWTNRQNDTLEADRTIGPAEGKNTDKETNSKINGNKNNPICLSLRRHSIPP
jgi:hypothetical protein